MSKCVKYLGPKARAQGYRATTWTVQELIGQLGTEFTVFTSSGHVSGVEMFCRESGKVEDGKFVVRAGDGHVICSYSFDRKLRIIVK